MYTDSGVGMPKPINMVATIVTNNQLGTLAVFIWRMLNGRVASGRSLKKFLRRFKDLTE